MVDSIEPDNKAPSPKQTNIHEEGNIINEERTLNRAAVVSGCKDSQITGLNESMDQCEEQYATIWPLVIEKVCQFMGNKDFSLNVLNLPKVINFVPQ